MGCFGASPCWGVRAQPGWPMIGSKATRPFISICSTKGLRRLGTFRVLVADDHRLMLAAVRRALAEADDFEIVGEISVGSRVLPAVRETNPHLVLLDMRMPELDGLTCLTRLRNHDPAIAVVILSSYSDEAHIDAARHAGALAYIVKTIEPVDLPAVLRSALAGRPFAVWGEAIPQSIDSTQELGLSERETVVLEAVARGLSNREIGRELWISEQTVKFHLRNLYRKLGVSSRTEAARYAYRAGLVAALTADSA
jgi:DNA-binding NarL/FixJ family response regulator